ncbi:MAG: flagellar assembly protein FliW [Bacillota bacterium]
MTSRFGVLEVAETDMIEFVHAFLGFNRLKEYFLVPAPENPYFTWLQAKEDPDVAFLLVNPFAFFPEYEFDLPEHYRQELGIAQPEDVAVYSTVTIPPGRVKEMTANLVGPVIINPRQRRGMQLVLETTKYGAKHKLFKHPQRAKRVAGE